MRFKNIAYKDLAIKKDPPEEVGSGFRMQRLSPFYYGWSAAAADFNHDGKMDIVSGPFIYFGPDYLTSREIYPAEAYNASTQYSMNDWVEHAYDFTGDGWPDVLTTSHAGGGKDGAVLYVNPKGESRRWDKYKVVPVIQSEETVMKDVDGDGKPELVYEAEGYMRYAKPDPANPTGTWIIHTVSERVPGLPTALAQATLTAMDGWTFWAPTGGGNNLRRKRRSALEVSSCGLWQLGAGVARRQRNWRLRRKWGWTERRRHQPAGAWLGACLV